MADSEMEAMAQRGGPLWWVQHLDNKIRARIRRTKKFDDYYEGNHQLQFATERFREAFGQMFQAFADNWCDIVVDVPIDRMTVVGFRFGEDQEGDTKAWDLWQRNNMDSRSKMLFTEAGISEAAFTLVWPSADDDQADISVEHPWQCAVEVDGGNPLRRLAGVKRWTDESTGRIFATLFTPAFVYKFASTNAITRFSTSLMPRVGSWGKREIQGEEWPLPNPLGVVPIVPLENRPRMLVPGRSDLRDVVPIQNAVNKVIADMMIASEFGAVPARWATGLEIERDPETKQPVQSFDEAVRRLWTNKKAEGKFGSFDPADLSNFASAVDMLIQHIATQSQIPPHHFFLRGEFPSGDSIVAAEAGLVRKVNGKSVYFGEGLEETMRLAMLAAGDEARGHATAMETIWEDPETRSESMHIDAMVKMLALGIPQEIVWERAGLTPQEIARAQKLIAAQPAPEPIVVDPAANPAAA